MPRHCLSGTSSAFTLSPCWPTSASLTQLADQVGVTVGNLSILKNQRAKAVRFSTLTALCHALECQPGDLLSVDPID
jgi:putative transcriptional regulator